MSILTTFRKFSFLVIIFMLFFSSLYAFKLDFSLTGYLTYDINNGTYDNFPMVYWTITLPEPLSNFSLKLTDYITYTHGTFDVFGYNLILPRYYFIDSRFDWAGWRTTFQLGRLRLTRSLTQNYESVRLGGFKFDTYDTKNQSPLTVGGIAGYTSYKSGNYTYEIGGAYSIDLNKFALYGVLTMNLERLGTGKLGVYYENRYENASINYSHQMKGDYGQINVWTGLAAVQSNLLEPSFILGATWKNGPWNINGQFLYIGANKYDVEFGSGEPSEPNSSYSWNFMSEIGYDFSQFYLGAFLKYNSRWLANEWLPLYGLKLKIADLTLSFGNGDLSSSLLDVQNVLLQLTYNYKASVDFVSVLSSFFVQPTTFSSSRSTTTEQTKQTQSTQTSVKIKDLYKMPEGSKVTVTGVVLSPVGLLSSSTTYINDETGGIMLYGKSLPTDLKVGDTVSVSGSTKIYNGILEIIVDSVTRIGSGKVTPKYTDSVNEEFLSDLVSITGTVKNISKDTIIVETKKDTVKVYIKSATGISISNLEVGKTIEVLGIVSLFKNEYEVLLRFQSDIKY